MRFAILIVVAIHQASLVNVAHDAAVTTPILRPEIEMILRDWKNSRAGLNVGDMTWQLANQLRSYQGSAVPVATEKQQQVCARKDTVRVRFDPRTITLEGLAVPAMQWGPPSLADHDFESSNRYFREILMAGRLKEGERHEQYVPYAIQIDGRRETHQWTHPTSKKFCRAIFSAGTAGSILYFDATKSHELPAIMGLVEAIRLALLPDLLMDAAARPEEIQLSAVQPIINGRKCLAVEFPIHTRPEQILCRLVIDPSRTSRVYQATFRTIERQPLSQYDVEYDCDTAGRWWPREVIVLQFSHFGDPYDELRLVRADLKPVLDSSPAISLAQPTTGTLVIDQADNDQYVVQHNGHHSSVSLTEAVEKIDYDPRQSHPSVLQETLSRVQIFAQRLVTWPWILMTFAILLGLSTLWNKCVPTPVDQYENTPTVGPREIEG